MTVKNTAELLANSSIETRPVFYCPEWPQFIWDLHHTTSFKINVGITTIACPVTILLNLLVIIAVKTRRELKTNSNILLSSVALTDLLVGALSMPLSITLDTLVIQRVLDVGIICTIGCFINVSLMYTICGASFLHLFLIAWERYVAVAKWKDYKVIVTRDSVKKYTRVAWLLALLMAVPSVVIEYASGRYEILLVVDVILSIFWLTVFFAVSGFPIVVAYLFRGVSPFFRQVSTIRWAETILQLNSLFNPLLYWYRTSRFRKTTLELLRCRKRPTARTSIHCRQRRYSVALLDVEKFQSEQLQKRPRFLRSKSLGVEMCSDIFRPRSSKAVRERSVSAPSRAASHEIFTRHLHTSATN